MIYDYGRTIPQTYWTTETFTDYQKILQKLEELDRKLNQPDCHDPAKAAWMREVEKRLSAIEQGTGKAIPAPTQSTTRAPNFQEGQCATPPQTNAVAVNVESLKPLNSEELAPNA